MNQELVDRVVRKIQECTEIVFQRTGQRVVPAITFNVRGTTAGKGGIDFRGNPIVSFNKILLMENPELFLETTVPHEYAHAVQLTLYRFTPGGKGHGVIWQRIMNWLGVPANRCHSYDVSNARVRRVSKTEYACGCSTHKLTLTRVNRMNRGVTYTCKKCGQRLTVKTNLVPV